MFSKKPHSDIKKSSQKVLDSKKDSLSRLKHLRIVLENSDNAEAKTFFESNYSHIYYILYDVFISVENNLKQRAHHRTHREELDVVRYIFEKLLLLLPELLSRRWQCHSIQRIMKKFLHSGNSTKLRREGIRLFLLWYQIVGDNAPDELDSVFATLVPGVVPGLPNPYLSSQNQIHSHGVFRPQSGVPGDAVYPETSTFYAPAVDDSSPVCPGEILPLLPPLSGEQQPEDVTRLFLDCVLEFMVSQVCKIEWKEKSDFKYQRCFCFLFEKFKKYYLPHIFPNFSPLTSLYIPSLAIPELRYANGTKTEYDASRFAQKDTLQHCQSIMVRWMTHFTQCLKKSSTPLQQPVQTAEQREQNDSSRPNLSTESENSQSTVSLLSTTSVPLERDPSSQSISNDELSFKDYNIVRETLYSTRENINLIQEIFRQAFLMPFDFASTMRKVVAVYREWIHKNSTDKPLFLDEPVAEIENTVHSTPRSCDGNPYSSCAYFLENSESPDMEPLGMRLRKDSYLKAIHSDHNYLKAGLQNMLKVFISNAANVFLLDISSEGVQLLEEQVDMCKRVLNIYRYMVMNVPMERRVWEMLLLVLLQITSMVLREVPPVRKDDTLGGRLAPALFQTLIVTWIKANLNVIISVELWDQFLQVLSSLTQWEELIKEWAKTMETLTRVLAKQVYCLDLNDLPLDRMSERKIKKTRGMKKPPVTSETKFDKSKSYDGHSVDTSGSQNCNSFEESSQGTARENYQPSSRTRSESGDESQKPETTCDFLPIRKSASDSNLAKKHSASLMNLQITPITSEQKQVLMVTGASPSTEDELSTLALLYECSPDDPFLLKQMYSRQKSKSLDFLSHRAESPCFSESSDCRSRSPSPTPSSGLENTSIKDSPMQIDVLVSSTDNSCNNSEVGSANCVEAQSVMSGGTTRGWMSDVAVVLWKRMLGALGDINFIKDANIHAHVLKYLLDLTKLLMKIRDNLGVSLDNQSSPPPPELAPPLLLITPWLFQALNLSEKYKQGKLLAFELLCILSVRHHDLLVSMDYLVQFYYILHNGLTGMDQDAINIIIKSCGPKFFSAGLPGCSLLLMDFLVATKTIIAEVNLKMPRTEAVSIVGSLLCFPNVYKNLTALQPSASDLHGAIYKDAKDRVTHLIIKAGKREHSGLGRCIAICSIGIYIYGELMNETYHHRIKEGISVLLAVVGFNCKRVAQVSSDTLLLLSDHAHKLYDNYPDLLRSIIEVMCSTLSNLLPTSDAVIPEDDKKFILSLIHCLGEWCMCVHQSFLIGMSSTSSSDWDPPLLSVLKVLNFAASGTDATSNESAKTSMDLGDLSIDVDQNIQLDNFLDSPTRKVPSTLKNQSAQEKASGTSENSFFRPSPRHREADSSHNVIRLAARNVLNHLVNHLGHFPMGIGAVRLTSLITEHDDVPTLTGDELSAEVFHAPNIQFFVLNNCSIISFVEIPALEMPGGGAAAGLATSQSQVRAIIRDLGGKFSWDCSVLYGPPDCCGGSYILEPDIIPCLSIPSQPQSLLSTTANVTNCGSPLPDQTLRHRLSEVLPTTENSADDLDNLDDLLQFVGHSSPECVSKPVKALNCPPKLLCEDSREKEMDIMNLILNQRNNEQAQFQKFSGSSSMEAKSIYPPSSCENSSPFQYCRLLLNQLGYTSWEKRATCDLLKKNEQLLRELRNLDKQKCRETHKIAVIYVAEGQEDKNSILTNCGGSQEFEEFVAGLGWEVELQNHLGFLGGLQRNKTTGDTAPYYATSFLEVIFHVSTRMSASLEEEAMTRKMRHLGNDEVHIVWSEHVRDYRKEIIATEFCDVLIAIYPIGGRLYRIHISRKSEVPFFGPLFNGAIVEHKVLPGLVRATAINASRAMRSLVSLYQNFYEERFRSLEIIVQNHKEKTAFEQFAANVYSPAPTRSHTPNRSSGPPSRTDSTSSRGITNLAAALLDAQNKGSGYSPNLRSRPVSQSTTESLSQQSSPLVPVRDRPLSASQYT